MNSRFTEKEHAVLCWLATADGQNRPNVSPKEIFLENGAEQLVIADIASARSVRNILENPAVCVSLVDIFLQRGRKIEGLAKIINPDHPEFTSLAAPLIKKVGEGFAIRNVISVAIERSTPILAPSYVFFPDRSEEELRQAALDTYGVQRRSK